MLSLTRVSSGQASTYYQVDDYYLQETGEWQGNLTDELNLKGEIKEADFQKIIEGIDPNGKFEIQAGGHDHSHTAGVDLTFSAPKSVSVAGLVLDDERVLEAHNAAVSKTLDYIEQNYTNVRIHEKEQVYNQQTGNMLAAKFQHVSSRELDPQLHTHCLVINVTKKEDGEFKAMDFGEMYDKKMFLGQVYRSELAANLKELGYAIETDKNGLFEIKGVPHELMKEFSTRSEQIKERLAELRVEYPTLSESKLKELATLDSRENKKEIGIAELKENWNNRVAEMGINKDNVITTLKEHGQIDANINKIDEIMSHAVAIATEHEAVVKKEDILRVATKLSTGEHRIADIEEAFKNNKELIKYSGDAYTTKETMTKEQGIINIVRDGQNQLDSILEPKKIHQEVYKYELEHGFKLTDGQKQAVEHVMTSRDRVIAIQGDAGTGKTTMLDVVRTIAEKKKLEIVGMSFTGKAASEIQEASQIKSSTIASFMNSNESLSSKLVVIDEASMLSIRDTDSLLKRCDDSTKIVLIGDTKQLQAIGQGKIFSSLQEKEVISTVRMAEVQRQTNTEYKDIVDNLAAKEIDNAINKLEANNKIHEMPDKEKRLEAIQTEYLKDPKNTIIVTAANEDREELNKMIRGELVATGKVNDNGKSWNTKEIKSMAPDEKYYAQSYNIGDIIVANNKAVMSKSGESARVMGVDQSKQTITVFSSNDKTYDIDLKQHGKDIQVYTKQSKIFAEGDKILFLKNDKGIDVKNGNTGYIQNIREDGMMLVKMDNGKEINLNLQTQYNYVSHGYALTDFKSQGQTAKNVIYHADTQKGINFNQAYVGITRGKENVQIYTDSKDGMRADINQDQNKTSTLNYGMEKQELNRQRPQIQAIKASTQEKVMESKEISQPLKSISRGRGM